MESPKQPNIHEVQRQLEQRENLNVPEPVELKSQENVEQRETQQQPQLQQKQQLFNQPLSQTTPVQGSISGQLGCHDPLRQGPQNVQQACQHPYIQNQFPNFGQNVQKQFLNIDQNVSDPTVDLFNRCTPGKSHCFLGRTGVKVCRLTLGSMNFGKIDEKFGQRPGQLDEAQAHKILDRYFELGGNCIDTANFFPWFGSTAGESEEIIGNWLSKLEKNDREKIFLITKIRLPDDEDNINSCGLSRFNIMNQVKRCLNRLQTDYIDLLEINGWDYSVNVMDLVQTLSELVLLGKIRYYGVCDLKAWQTQKLIDYARIANCHRCICYEGEYNLLSRGIELEIADVCQNERIGFIACSPLKYGFLSGESVEGTRIESARNRNSASMAEPYEEIQKEHDVSRLFDSCHRIAQRRNLTAAQVSLLWVLQQEFVSTAIIGVESIEELEENMACITSNISLSDEDLMELNDAAYFKYDYPYNCIASFAGYQFIRPTLNSYFEQMSLVYKPTSPVTGQFPQYQQRYQQIVPQQMIQRPVEHVAGELFTGKEEEKTFQQQQQQQPAFQQQLVQPSVLPVQPTQQVPTVHKVHEQEPIKPTEVTKETSRSTESSEIESKQRKPQLEESIKQESKESEQQRE